MKKIRVTKLIEVYESQFLHIYCDVKGNIQYNIQSIFSYLMINEGLITEVFSHVFTFLLFKLT